MLETHCLTFFGCLDNFSNIKQSLYHFSPYMNLWSYIKSKYDKQNEQEMRPKNWRGKKIKFNSTSSYTAVLYIIISLHSRTAEGRVSGQVMDVDKARRTQKAQASGRREGSGKKGRHTPQGKPEGT